MPAYTRPATSASVVLAINAGAACCLQVVCRQLGFSKYIQVVGDAYFYGKVSPQWKGVTCNGSEPSLLSCSFGKLTYGANPSESGSMADLNVACSNGPGGVSCGGCMAISRCAAFAGGLPQRPGQRPCPAVLMLCHMCCAVLCCAVLCCAV